MPPPSLAELGLVSNEEPERRLSGERLPKPKKFRFQLLTDYIVERFDPKTRIADVGGGKGFLTYLLRQEGFEACCIDPETQALPGRYKDLRSGQRVRIDPGEQVPRFAETFEIRHTRQFDLLVGLHAHGSNLLMLEAAAQHKKRALLMPCCVIGEPEAPPRDKSWFKWLVHRAQSLGLSVDYFYLNFKGQNVGFVVEPDQARPLTDNTDTT